MCVLIYLLNIIQRMLYEFGVMARISRLLSPLLKLFGLPERQLCDICISYLLPLRGFGSSRLHNRRKGEAFSRLRLRRQLQIPYALASRRRSLYRPRAADLRHRLLPSRKARTRKGTYRYRTAQVGKATSKALLKSFLKRSLKRLIMSKTLPKKRNKHKEGAF